jgi:hypothetical protein
MLKSFFNHRRDLCNLLESARRDYRKRCSLESEIPSVSVMKIFQLLSRLNAWFLSL